MHVWRGSDPPPRARANSNPTVARRGCVCVFGLSRGERGETDYGVALHYKGAPFHRVIPGFVAQGGDFTLGRGGASIYGGPLADEWERGLVQHERRGLLSMANAGPNTATSQFFVTLAASARRLDGDHVVFGAVARDRDGVLDKIERVGSETGTPQRDVVIANCGALPPPTASRR